MEEAVLPRNGEGQVGQETSPLPKEAPAAAPPNPLAFLLPQTLGHAQGGPWMPAGLEAPAPSTEVSALPLPSRYRDLGLLGRGGMGEVRRVHDEFLGRTVAMKLLRREVLSTPESVARFIEEAQATAQLQHPGIVPVHELGRLPDGRWYFTLKEISGRTLGAVIAEVHGAVQNGLWEASASGWTFRRLMEAFLRVCETVAYAHTRRVLHRDLKPSNVMVGTFGEVLVLDWGLAKVRESSSLPQGEGTPLGTIRSREGAMETRAGQILGTPAYMSPEQARGEPLGPASDVYALGAILYEILSGHPPYEGGDAFAIVRKVLLGAPAPPVRRPRMSPAGETLESLESAPEGFVSAEAEPRGPVPQESDPIPPELRALCLRAMSRHQSERPADAGALAREVEAWLAGEQRRAEALRLVTISDAMQPELASLRSGANLLRAEAQALSQSVAAYEPVERKLPVWQKEAAAEALEQQHDMLVLRYVQTLGSALNHDPGLIEAHDRLASHYRAEHVAAEESRDVRSAARYEALLRAHDLSGRCAAYLQGDGALTIWTDPPGAEVELHRHTLRERRLVAEPVRMLGRTPLTRVSLPMGSYLLVLRAEGRVPVRYPVRIHRQTHWDGVAPGGREPLPIVLPHPAELGPDDLYVPAGGFQAGGDPLAAGTPLPAQRVWVDGFVIRRFPVTHQEYLAFLNARVAQGREEESLKAAPRERAARPDEAGALLYARDRAGRFFLDRDAEGDRWGLDGPAVMMDWFGASAYSAWMAEHTGQPWRLLGELEWEKAARGVDGRYYPWGDTLDPTWCCMRDSHAGLPRVAAVSEFPADESPYLVRGMAGNVADWCQDFFRREGPVLHEGRYRSETPSHAPPTVVPRGGNWYMDASMLRLASRIETGPIARDWSIGLRLARSFPTASSLR